MTKLRALELLLARCERPWRPKEWREMSKLVVDPHTASGTEYICQTLELDYETAFPRNQEGRMRLRAAYAACLAGGNP